MRLLGYIRVSTDSQADEGVSLQAQRAQLEAYAVAMGVTLVDIVEDAGYSAKSMDRPGLRMALQALRVGEADGLLVTKLDRLTRSVKDLGALVETVFQKHALVAVHDHVDTQTPAGRLVLHILAAVSQWEREAIASRTKSSMAHLKAQGVRLGRAPYGLRRSEERDEHGRRKWVVDEADAPAIERIVELHQGGWSIRGIASKMEAEGFRTKDGREVWRRSQIHVIVKRLEAIRSES